MVERVNGTIKNATIKAEDYDNIDDVKKDLNKFLIFYNFNRLLLKPFSIFGYMSLRSYFNLKYKSNFNITKI